MKILLLPSAERDIDRIYDHVTEMAGDSRFGLLRVEEIEDAIDDLGQVWRRYPIQGRTMSGVDVRKRPIGRDLKMLMFYLCEEAESLITVVYVAFGAEDRDVRLKERLTPDDDETMI